ncbi:hypothetical protein O3M35_006193 [Rhynocoris fuscipes]|uniref:Uncharacterized protein n=1 Tax=Rhynocoris fuscipes TaxID=488301 RepID=A0AAW1DCF8_9HEMI
MPSIEETEIEHTTVTYTLAFEKKSGETIEIDLPICCRHKRELPVKAAKLCAWVLLVVSILSLGFMFMLMHYLEKTIPCPYFDPDM